MTNGTINRALELLNQYVSDPQFDEDEDLLNTYGVTGLEHLADKLNQVIEDLDLEGEGYVFYVNFRFQLLLLIKDRMPMSITPKKKVNFRVYPSNIYGDQFKNVIVKSAVDLDDANRLNHDALAAFIAAEPTLPPTAITNVQDETFYIIQFDNNEEVVIGSSWVIPDSIEYLSGTKVILTIPQAGWDSLQDIKAGLASRGYTIENVDVVSQ